MRLILWMTVVHWMDIPLLTSGIDPKIMWMVAAWAAAFDLFYAWGWYKMLPLQTEEYFDVMEPED